MGTNFYVDEPVCSCPCPHCAAPKRPHIGKFTRGWEFSFFAGHGPSSWKEWKAYLQDRKITDEHGIEYTYAGFVAFVEESRRPGYKNHTLHCREKYPATSTSLYIDEEGWSFSPGRFF